MVLHPQRIDEAVQSSLREKTLAEKMSRMSVSPVAMVCLSYKVLYVCLMMKGNESNPLYSTSTIF